MHVSRSVFHVESVVRKLSSRFRRTLKIQRSEWPVISAVRPLFCLIKFFGLAPIEISGSYIKPWSWGVIYAFICVVIHSYIEYTVLYKNISAKREKVTLHVIETGKVIFNYGVVLFNISIAVWTRNEFVKVLNILKQFDSRIRDLGHPRKEKAAKIWVWSTCFCSAFLWIVVNRTGMTAFSESWIYNVAYILNYITTSLSVIKFSGVVLLLGQRFRHLNDVAKRSKETLNTKQKYFAIDFRAVQQLHNNLMNAGESLNCQYSWSILIWLINLCVHAVSNLYFLINWLMVNSEWTISQLPLVNCISCWLIAFIAQLILLHIACDFTCSEANDIGAIITNWKIVTVSRNYKIESSLYLLNRKLNFSAAGCFYVNLPLLSSIAGILTTYLVLLIQFH